MTAALAASALLTWGLWEATYLEPTGEAVRAARTGRDAVLVASAALVGLGLVAWRRLQVRGLLAALPIGAAVLCGWASTTDGLAVLTLVVAYPCVLAGVLGVLLAGGSRRPVS